MKKIVTLFTTFIFSLAALMGCASKEPQRHEVEGGKVENSYKAPDKIESRNIESFKTSFFLWDTFNEENVGGYSFSIEKNDKGEYVLSEDSHYNIQVVIDKSVLEHLQIIIEENNLAKSNGMDRYTKGLPEEYAPCMLLATYDSGEKLYFSVDNNPEAKWAQDMMKLFKREFINQGHEELLPPIEDRTVIRFDMGYTDGICDYSYLAIFTEDDTDERPVHYLVNIYNRETKETEFDDIVQIPEGFYENLSNEIGRLNLVEYQNGEMPPGDTSSLEQYAYFCIEMQSGCQFNGFFEGDDANVVKPILIDSLSILIDLNVNES